MFKLVQSSGKAISGIVTSALAAGQPLKIIKTVSAGGQEQQQQQQQQVGDVYFCEMVHELVSLSTFICFDGDRCCIIYL